LINQYDSETMKQYQTYHDCGKPYCRVVDDEGKQHFPDHARISSEIYAKYFDYPASPTSPNFPDSHLITLMISDDMNFHTLKSEELNKWFKLHENNPKYLCSLYLTAWAEIISNSKMFGGMESTSYKIKRKTLIGCAKRLYTLFEKRKKGLALQGEPRR